MTQFDKEMWIILALIIWPKVLLMIICLVMLFPWKEGK